MKGFVMLTLLAIIAVVTLAKATGVQFSSLTEVDRFKSLFKREADKGEGDDDDDKDAPWKHCPYVACPHVYCPKPGPQDCKKHEDCGEGKKCCTFCCWTRKCH